MILKKILSIVLLVFGLSSLAFAVPSDATIKSIAYGHAYDKHVVTNGEFPKIKSKEEFYNYIKAMVADKSTVSKKVGTKEYLWRTPVIVAVDPSHKDKGTCFKPIDGKKYYDKQ